jgi:hypothetical protein
LIEAGDIGAELRIENVACSEFCSELVEGEVIR